VALLAQVTITTVAGFLRGVPRSTSWNDVLPDDKISLQTPAALYSEESFQSGTCSVVLLGGVPECVAVN
jgi:hypothetical protein